MPFFAGIIVGALSLLGFTPAGVVAGSIAATVQSMFFGGTIAAGSWFAICQSIGATANVAVWWLL